MPTFAKPQNGQELVESKVNLMSEARLASEARWASAVRLVSTALMVSRGAPEVLSSLPVSPGPEFIAVVRGRRGYTLHLT